MTTKNFKILIVDDSPSIISFISAILQKEGHITLTATNGQMAYEIAESNFPDLIITDWEMPVMTGLELIKKLKQNKNTRHIPIVMITGKMNTMEDLKNAFQMGAIDFIHKPIDPIELIARSRSMLMYAYYLNENLLLKNKELTILSNKILEHSDRLKLIIEKLSNLQHLSNDDCACTPVIKDLISEISINTKDQAWKELLTQFKTTHPNFIENLLKKLPKLSKNEIKLCVFLKQNLNSKEIASLTFQNASSVDIARYRLRKKIGLKRNDNLNTFLMKF